MEESGAMLAEWHGVKNSLVGGSVVALVRLEVELVGLKGCRTVGCGV